MLDIGPIGGVGLTVDILMKKRFTMSETWVFLSVQDMRSYWLLEVLGGLCDWWSVGSFCEGHGL